MAILIMVVGDILIMDMDMFIILHTTIIIHTMVIMVMDEAVDIMAAEAAVSTAIIMQHHLIKEFIIREESPTDQVQPVTEP